MKKKLLAISKSLGGEVVQILDDKCQIENVVINETKWLIKEKKENMWEAKIDGFPKIVLSTRSLLKLLETEMRIIETKNIIVLSSPKKQQENTP